MFCKNCGQEVDNNSDFCPNCGACLKEAPDTTTNYVNQPQCNNQYNNAQQYNNTQQYNNVQPYNNAQQYNNVQPYNNYQQYNNFQQNQVPKTKLNVISLVGFIISLASMVFLTGVASLVGMILSIVGLNQIKKTGERGHGFALAGTIVGAVLLGISVLAVIGYVAWYIFLLGEINNSLSVCSLVMLAF